MTRFLLWLRQPTSVAGLSALVGIFSAMALHQIGFTQAVPLLAGAFASIALPDNAGAKAIAEALARKAVAQTSIEQEKA